MNAKQNASLCRTCLKRTDGKPPICPGHGKTGGGASGGGDSGLGAEKADAMVLTSSVHADATLASSKANAVIRQMLDDVFRSTTQADVDDDYRFDTVIISQLLRDKMLTIESNPLIGRCVIDCRASLLNKEQQGEVKKFMKALLNAFEQFKQDNNIEGYLPEIKKDRHGNIGFAMSLPAKAGLYEAFVNQLVNKGLLPEYVLKEMKTPDYKNNADYFKPTPFNKQPMPQSKPRKEDAHDIHADGKKKRTPLKMEAKPKGAVE